MVTQQIEWVLLSYRIPREPSTPRISIWRKLKRLGVAQLGDGLVALPHDARTKEHLEWISAEVHEAGGDAIVWIATPASRRPGEDIARKMRDDRDVEYSALLDDIGANPGADGRTVRRWRREWQRISRRDHFRAPKRDSARLAIDEAAAALGLTMEQRT